MTHVKPTWARPTMARCRGDTIVITEIRLSCLAQHRCEGSRSPTILCSSTMSKTTMTHVKPTWARPTMARCRGDTIVITEITLSCLAQHRCDGDLGHPQYSAHQLCQNYPPSHTSSLHNTMAAQIRLSCQTSRSSTILC